MHLTAVLLIPLVTALTRLWYRAINAFLLPIMPLLGLIVAEDAKANALFSVL